MDVNINASIIDQQLDAVVEDVRERAADQLGLSGNEGTLRSLAFVYFCVKTLLDLDDEAAFDALVEGGQDFGVDALHIADEHDGEFTVTLFQGKYQKRRDAQGGFPATGIEKLVQAIRYLFDPSIELININDRLRVRVEEARSFIRDGLIPQVRVVACNNGKRWGADGDELIRLAGFGDQVVWDHTNHDRLVQILQAMKPVSDRLQLAGRFVIEDMNFSRVLIGRVAVEELAALIDRHGERLLERNIRRYLGLQGNRVNEGIRDTLLGPDRSSFYFFDNGVTLTCDKLEYNALQGQDVQVRVQNLQIINGGQTCMTIHRTLRDAQPASGDPAYVLLRIYQLPSDADDLVRQITFATNSQNPVDLRDLRANDQIQQRLELDLRQLGYDYRRKRTGSSAPSNVITSAVAAEALLAVWRRRPQQARFSSREHFAKLYSLIFAETVSGAEVATAVLLYRIAEGRRKRPRDSDPPCVRYASCFVAMQMGRRLLRDLRAPALAPSHFAAAKALIEQKGEAYFADSLADVEWALERLYGEQQVSLQQLSATFRRGDLIELLLRRAVSDEAAAGR